MSDTLLTSPSKTNLSSSSGTPMGPGRSAAACAKVRGRHQGLATGVVCDELCGGNEGEGEENAGGGGSMHWNARVVERVLSG